MTSPAPARLPIPGSFQMTLKLLHQEQPAAIVLGASGGGSGMTPALAGQWRDAFWTAFRPVIGDNVQMLGAVIRETGGPDGVVWELGPTASPTGTGSGVKAVAAACTLVKWTTPVGGRTGRGRTFIPGLVQGALLPDGRGYQPVHATNTAACITAYLGNATLQSAGLAPAVLSFTRGEARLITGGSLATVVGLQRKRMRA